MPNNPTRGQGGESELRVYQKDRTRSEQADRLGRASFTKDSETQYHRDDEINGIKYRVKAEIVVGAVTLIIEPAEGQEDWISAALRGKEDAKIRDDLENRVGSNFKLKIIEEGARYQIEVASKDPVNLMYLQLRKYIESGGK